MAMVICKNCNKYTPADRGVCIGCDHPLSGLPPTASCSTCGCELVKGNCPGCAASKSVATQYQLTRSPIAIAIVGGLVLFVGMLWLSDQGSSEPASAPPPATSQNPSAPAARPAQQPSAALTDVRLQRMARESVQAYLKDPSSAEFRNQKGLCGEVNSKNSFGAFTGFQRFMAGTSLVVLERDSGMDLAEFQKAWDAVCK